MGKNAAGKRTRRGRQELKDREPKVHENPKSIVYLHGAKCSQVVKEAFKAMHDMTRDQSALYSRKHTVRPMDDHSYLENLAQKHDVSLFLVGTSNKKRPNCITIARMFNFRLLDMSELQVLKFTPSHKFKGIEKPSAGGKPAIIFQGHAWEHEEPLKQLKSLFTDVFRGPIVSRVNLYGTDRAVIFSADDTHVFMRHYRVLLKGSGGTAPIVELEECGPSVDFKIGRIVYPAEEVMKQAMKQPKQLMKKTQKNIEFSGLGDRLGRVHMQKQDMDNLQLRKVKALKRSAKEREEEKQSRPTDPTAGGRKKPKQSSN